MTPPSPTEPAAAFRLLGVSSVDDASLDRWQRLAASARTGNVFLTPGTLLPALRHLADGRVRLGVVVRDDQWQLLVVLRPGSRAWRHPVRATTTWEHSQMFLRAPLVAAGATAADWDALLGGVAAGQDSWWVLDDLDVGVADQVRAAAGRRGLPAVRLAERRRSATRRRDEDDYARRALSSKKRKELRRQARRLEEDLGGDLEVVDLARTPDGVAEAVGEFLRLEASGWKRHDGGAMATRPDEAAFFLEACTALAERGDLFLLALRGASGVAAMAVLARSGGTVFQWKIAYDEEHAAWSPGMQVAVETFTTFHSSGAQLLDSCAVPGHWMAGQVHLDTRSLTTLAVGLGPRRGAVALALAPRWLALRRVVADRPTSREVRAALAALPARVRDRSRG